MIGGWISQIVVSGKCAFMYKWSVNGEMKFSGDCGEELSLTLVRWAA